MRKDERGLRVQFGGDKHFLERVLRLGGTGYQPVFGGNLPPKTAAGGTPASTGDGMSLARFKFVNVPQLLIHCGRLELLLVHIPLNSRFATVRAEPAILSLTTGTTCDPLVVPALAGFLALAG
ncbi:MAG: hypothetical protein HY735_22940 [Verrucomicrobia bacterium]|nr:hypothetical protein [Verrucomicrobiota bacterium]